MNLECHEGRCGVSGSHKSYHSAYCDLTNRNFVPEELQISSVPSVFSTNQCGDRLRLSLCWMLVCISAIQIQW